MGHRKYMHIERFGTDDVKGINRGKCYLFPKIDGCNMQCWIEDDETKAGSRNVELSADNDPQGFYEYIQQQDNIKEFLVDFPFLRLYGEWLIPHTLKTYREDAWENYYVFDAYDENKKEYLPYDKYKPLLEQYNIEYIPPLAIIDKPKKDDLLNWQEKNKYLIEDGQGSGEGIVIKNYDFVNKYGRTVWAKMVRNNFKEQHSKEMGAPEIKGKTTTEEKIIEKYVDQNFVDKEFYKIKTAKGWKSEYIPELFGRCFHELVTEEIWNIVKDFNKPVVDFKELREVLIYKIKELKPELF